jgi:mono/diheme cytochrome c family protein
LRGLGPGLLVAVAFAAAACAYRGRAEQADAGQGETGQADAGLADAGLADAGLALPPGEGRGILERQCLSCHELEALALFSGFYDRERWRSLVITMRANGAEVDDAEVEIVADYLARHFGTDVD